jgi:hypothetical protein
MNIAHLDPDQRASYLALSDDVLTIVSVAGLPPSAYEEGRALTRAYANALRSPSLKRWRAYHRAVATLLGTCTPAASRALDFPAVTACMRLRAFLCENPDLGTAERRGAVDQGDRRGSPRPLFVNS